MIVEKKNRADREECLAAQSQSPDYLRHPLYLPIVTPDFLNLTKADASVRPYFDKPDHLNSDGGHNAEYQISSLFHFGFNSLDVRTIDSSIINATSPR